MAVGLATIASRVLGYVRDVLVANLLGAGPVAEALLAALRAPNALRRTLGEGGLNAALTPLYIRLQIGRGDEAAAAFARDALTFAALVLTVLIALLALGAGTVIYLMAPGLETQPASFEAARWWFVLMTPFMGAATLASMAAAFLNAQRRYIIAAVAPAAVNAALVCAYLVIPRISADPCMIGTLMAGSLSIGGAAQLALTIIPLIPVLRRAKVRAAPESIANLARALRLGAPALAATASFQIIGIVASAAASQEDRALAWFYYADRLFQLPLSLAGVVIGSVLLTELSASRLARGHAVAGDNTLDRALIYALAIGLPAAAALFVLAIPIVDILFGHGAFSPVDISGTALALMVLAPGLPAGVAARVLLQELLVREKAWLSALCGATAVVVTAMAAFILTPVWGIGGACAAVTAGLWAQCATMGILLGWKGWWRPGRIIARHILKQVMAVAVMIALLVMLRHQLLEYGGAGGTSLRFLALSLICLAGALVYGAIIWTIGGIPQSERPNRGAP